MNANTEAPATNPPNGKRRRILLLIAVIFIVIGGLVGRLLGAGAREARENRRRLRERQPGGDFGAGFRHRRCGVGGRYAARERRAGVGEARSHRCADRAEPRGQRLGVRPCGKSVSRKPRPVNTIRKSKRASWNSPARRPIWQSANRCVADQAIAGEEVRHAQESVQLARAALAQAERQSLSAHALVDGTAVRDNPAVLQAKDAYRDAWIAAQRNARCRAGHRLRRRAQRATRAAHPGRRGADDGDPAAFAMGRCELQGSAVAQPAHRPEGRGAQRSYTAARLFFTGTYRACRPARAPRFRCCRRKMPPAIGSRWCSAYRCEFSIDDDDLIKSPLRVGLSATVTVDTTDRAAARYWRRRPADKPVGDTQVYTQDLEKANAEADAIVRRNLGIEPTVEAAAWLIAAAGRRRRISAAARRQVVFPDRRHRRRPRSWRSLT